MSEIKWDEKFRDFLKRYYWDDILLLANEYPEMRSIVVDFPDLEQFDSDLAHELLEHPDDVIPYAEQALREIDIPIEKDLDDAHVQFINIPNRIGIRDLRSKHLLKFISIEGMIRKATEVRPKVTNAAFMCMRCENTSYEPQDGPKFVEPNECENESCGKKGPFKLLIDQSTFVDAQKLQVQESPENLKGGSQPQSLDVDAEDDLAGIVKPGDRLVINGILRSHQRTLREGKSTFYDLVLHANSLEYVDQEFDELDITPEDEETILDMSKDPNIYNNIIGSIAPSIYGYEDIKEALSLQLFSAVPKMLPDGSRVRGDIHILLVGDPGIAKSQLLRYMVKISPRGVFASGKSASSSGLTAAAVKDDLGDGRWTLEAGALVMADMGLASVDEMDKMSKEDKSALHEAMEQQTISVAKAGILATLKSRCALLGAANPKYGRFDKYEGLAEQINMPPALISRFDLIFILLDVPDRTKDSNIANHILKSHYAGELSEQRQKLPTSTVSEEDVESHMEVILPTIDNDLMRKYVAYARRKVFPIMEDEAREHIINYYLDLRRQGEGKDAPVPVTARQLEALVRLAEASARIRLSNVVTLDDAKRTTRISMACMRQVGVDPDTGALDVDVIASGTSKSQRDKIHLVKDIIARVSERHAGSKAPLEEVYAEAESENIERDRVEELITKMKRQGDLLSPDNKHIKIV
ncbi:minichromosome maintenance protein MCM [Methanococcoides methylutens]|uniref:DNA helicase n=1 Tax=Methanococcoides methylutens MM1 TaxID=1434104 RepID=A0A0E3SR54_METMT|nr:minichromosome maintenance protein MCM [Methanococcoides methylutens]AKB84627.1 DNA replication helicase protein MCM [Methanococcoides methylutens MM1]